jgi:hypothetical protein
MNACRLSRSERRHFFLTGSECIGGIPARMLQEVFHA